MGVNWLSNILLVQSVTIFIHSDALVPHTLYFKSAAKIRQSGINGVVQMDQKPSDKNVKEMIVPPNLPPKYYTDFLIWYTERNDILPPWPHGPPIPYSVGKGRTFYDWEAQICVEEYDDYCVPIYKPSSYFSCTMINFNNTAYMMSPPKYGYGPCCIMHQTWLPPKPNFMQQFPYAGSTIFHHQLVDWWNIYTEDNVLFGGYGWTRFANERNYRVPVTFWYPGDIGWAMQNFYNFTDSGQKVQNISKFRPANLCYNAPLCDSLRKRFK